MGDCQARFREKGQRERNQGADEAHDEENFRRGDAVVENFSFDALAAQRFHTAVFWQRLDERAVLQHHDEPHFLIGLRNGLLQRIGGWGYRVAVAVPISAKDIFIAAEEVGQSCIFSVKAQQLAQFFVFDENHGFVLPDVGAQEPSRDDLFWRQAAVAVFPVEFQDEIVCQGVEWGNASVVDHLLGSQ